MPALNGRSLALVAAALSIVAAPGAAQDPCPSASAIDAESGWAAYVDNDMERARRLFQAAIARCGNDQYARTGLGYVELRDGNEAAAERNWSVVLSAEPNNVDALVGMGLARWRAGDIQGVRSRFERVLELSPEHPTALEYLERVAGARPAADGEGDAADRAWREGDTALAMRLYRARLAEDPESRTALLRVALMTAWDEQYQSAIDMLDHLLDLQPGHLDARLARARVRAWAGDLDEAQHEVAEVLAIDRGNAEALEALALFQAWAGEYQEALASYDELLSIAPGNSSLRRQQAQTLAWAADFEASRAAYDALLSRDPDDVDARLGLARALAFSGDFGGAVEQYDRVLARAPDDLRGLTGKARTLGWAERLVEAERVALEAVDLDEESAEAWGVLGRVYRLQGRTADAKEALEHAERLSPTNVDVRNQLRSVRLSLAPSARPTFVAEADSDGNRMLTSSVTAGWHPMPRLDLRAEVYVKQLEQELSLGVLERRARGLTLASTYELRPGWHLSAGVGGSVTDAPGDPTFLTYRLGVTSPGRTRVGARLEVATEGMHQTALLTERRVETTEVRLTAHWRPAPAWRVDGSAGVTALRGSQDNRRRGASLSGSRRIGRSFSVGGAFRGFSFQKNLNDGYFDPDLFGIWELTGHWLHRISSWTLLVELAPGLQQITTGGDVGASLRSNGRVAYRLGPGREVSLSLGYSSAGLTTFATSSDGYDYTAVILGANWIF